MNDLKNGCVVDIEKTFGNIYFVGVKDQITERVPGRQNRQRVGTMINVCCDKIPGNIQIGVRNRNNRLESELQMMDLLDFNEIVASVTLRRDMNSGYTQTITDLRTTAVRKKG